MSLLEVNDVSVRFGGIAALTNVSFSVEEGQICGLIGPNGAGKTTMFNVICGIYRTTGGSIRFRDRELTGRRSDQIVSAGLARTFQNVGLFPSLTVLENVMMGAYHRTRPQLRGLVRSSEKRLKSSALTALDRLGLADLRDASVGDQAIGTLKRIELARALVTEARMVMLDEPANGLTHGEAEELGDLIFKLRDEFKMTVVLVEHHMRTVMRVSDHIVALDAGRNLVSGTPDEVRGDPRLVEAYLGVPA